MTPIAVVLRSLRRIALLLVVALVLFVLVVPNTVLAFLRREYRWVDRIAGWAELLSSPNVDFAHVIAFGVLGFASRLALPRADTRWMVLALLGFAVSTEIAQFWIPGRTPLLLDVVEDMGGALLGMMLVSVLQWRRKADRQP